MKKYLWLTLILFILTVLTTGCGFESEAAPREHLDVSQWPTAVPPTPSVEPTPFPKANQQTAAASAETTTAPALSPDLPAELAGIDLSQIDLSQLEGIDLSQLQGLDLSQIDLSQLDLSGVDTSNLDLTDVAAMSDLAGMLAPDGQIPVVSGATTDLLNQAGALSGLSPVAVMKTSAPETTIRRGPGVDFGAVKTVEEGELGAILGTNAGGDWLYIITITNVTGWMPTSEAKIVGSLDEAPVLPNDPVAAYTQRIVQQTVAPNSGSAATVAPLNLSKLDPVATGLVSSSQVNLRQRPGPEFAAVSILPSDTQVAILGLNRDKEWALVTTAAGENGWVSLDHLDVTGSLTNAPQYRTLEPVDAAHAAPVVLLSSTGTAAPIAAAANPSTPTAPAAEVNSTPAQPALPGNGLAPAATALANTKVKMRSGPGEQYGALSEATVDMAVEILALNPGGDWAVVRAPNSKYGWVPVSALKITDGTLENAKPVFTGLVTSNNLPILSGPGIYYANAGLVNRNDLVSVQAINPGRNWILIETASGVRGWIQLRLGSKVTASLDELPVVEIDAVAQAEQQAGPAVAVPSGSPGGKMVIQLASGGQIMGINADGTGLTPLTHGIDPVLSPDGSQLAFTRWESGMGTLWVANADGSGERAVLGEMYKAKGPDWSPDGQQLVLNFQYGGRAEARRLCARISDNIPYRTAIDIEFQYENGKPVGVCYTMPPDPHWSLREVNRTTAEFKDLNGGVYAFRPAWDPKQEWRIVSDSGDGLLGIDANNPDFRQPLTDISTDGSPTFSPDGRFIALVSRGQDGANIFRTNPDGSGRVRLTQTPLWEGITPDQSSQPWNNVAPAWSPDGSRIAFLTDRTGRWEIWLMNADGSDQHAMFPDEINQQLTITYDFNDERVISWR
jgi:TolB protein